MIVVPVMSYHQIDEEMFAEIISLREERLRLAKEMKENMFNTARELHKHGEEGHSSTRIREELDARISVLETRLTEKHMLFADEIELYHSLLKGDSN